MISLVRFFVERPGVVNLLMLIIIVAGITLTMNMGLQGRPDVDFGVFTVTTQQAGANAEKIELSITVPLEEELLSVYGVKSVVSKSMAGLSLIELSTIPGTPNDVLDEIESDIQRAIDRARSQLPKDLLKRPLIKRTDFKEIPSVQLAVTGTASEDLLRSITRNLETHLRSVPDISKVDRVGYRDKQVRILLDPLKITQYRISFEEIEDAISRRNVSETGGSIESFVGEHDIMVIGEFKSPEVVGDVIIRAGDQGDYLRVRDIAEVVIDFADWRTRYFYEGNPALLVSIFRNTGINQLHFIKQLHADIDEFRATLPSNVKIAVINDDSHLVASLVNSLVNNAMIGFLLIVFTLLIFFPWRSMIWVVAGLPIAILIALAIANSMNMFIVGPMLGSVILMLGLLVDDAIVTSESIFRHHEMGYSPRDAAVAGVASVAQPVMTGALTTILAMSPILLISGHDSKFLWYVPATVIFLVIGSLLECFFLLPSHLAESLQRSGKPKEPARWFTRIEAAYKRVLLYYINKPFRSILVLVVFLVASVIAIKQFLIFKPWPEVDGIEVAAVVDLPVGSTLAATSELLLDLERKINAVEELKPYIDYTYVNAGEHQLAGFEDTIQGIQSNWGKVMVRLISHNDRDITSMDIAKQLDDMLGADDEHGKIKVVGVSFNPPIGKAVELAITAPAKQRAVIADELLDFLSEYPGVTRHWSDHSPGPNTIEVELNHEKLANYGLKVSEVSKALRIAFDGILVEELQTREELIRYRLQLQDSYRSNPAAIRSLNIVSNQGQIVPLRNIADFVVRDSESAILHAGGRPAETVYADIDLHKTSTQEINRDLQAFIMQAGFYQRFPGANINVGGELLSQAQSAQTMTAGLIFVLGSIFFIMVLLFNSFSLPIVTMLVIPVSLITVALLFTVQGAPLTMSAMVAFLGLAGVLVNGALVMIDQVRKLHRERGADTPYFSEEDIVKGAVMRLRPLLITGVTTLVGVGPAAYGFAGTDPNTLDMLKVIFWGVGVGALAIVFALPIYLVLDSKAKRFWEERREAKQPQEPA